MVLLPPAAVALAERQRGVIARFQLARWLGPAQIDGLVRRGFLLAIERGVYRVAGGARLAEQAPFAAALRSRPDAVVTGPFVLGHLRVDGYRPEDPFEILLAPGRRPPRNVTFPTRPDPIPQRPVGRDGEVRLAGPLDALIDAARFREVVGDRRLRLAYDWLRWRGLIDRDRVGRRLEELADVDVGARQLLEVLDGPGGLDSESDGERKLGRLAMRFDPPPEPQVYVTPARRADWYFRGLRQILEYLGSVDHDTLLGRIADDERDAELAQHQIRVRYVRRQDLDDVPALVASIAGTLAVRAHELGVAAPTLRPE